jgi:hypothetical protein
MDGNKLMNELPEGIYIEHAMPTAGKRVVTPDVGMSWGHVSVVPRAAEETGSSVENREHGGGAA